MSTSLHFLAQLIGPDGQGITRAIELIPRRLIVAGWTGRDLAAVEHHIEELRGIGVPRPSTVPLYYRVAAQMLTQSDVVEVLGPATSGEAEPMLFRALGEWWLTVASDHTDRALEAHSVACSKQICPKPVARTAWRWQDVRCHQDRLTLYSEIWEDGAWTPYQGGALASIRPLEQLLAGLPGVQEAEGTCLLCGTVPVQPNRRGQAIRPTQRMRLSLEDPQTSRCLMFGYELQELEVVS